MIYLYSTYVKRNFRFGIYFTYKDIASFLDKFSSAPALLLIEISSRLTEDYNFWCSIRPRIGHFATVDLISDSKSSFQTKIIK
jgi:hypothetical protein